VRKKGLLIWDCKGQRVLGGKDGGRKVSLIGLLSLLGVFTALKREDADGYKTVWGHPVRRNFGATGKSLPGDHGGISEQDWPGTIGLKGIDLINRKGCPSRAALNRRRAHRALRKPSK